MIEKYKKNSYILIGSGLSLFVVSKLITPSFDFFGPVVLVVSYFLVMFGCRSLAVAKGYSGKTGLLFGIFFGLGLLLLLFRKDKNKQI